MDAGVIVGVAVCADAGNDATVADSEADAGTGVADADNGAVDSGAVVDSAAVACEIFAVEVGVDAGV